ncbi:MAG TPA: bifunctional phosphopantothenoylcysteine decarboxylase/phosphopantothenate--cysteine ligase CoaBC, partial [Acidimicrobiales bacterium]|nr:bifunctional phosphopantothenoylcysteine decarboxylase/phosphopantothenate--cysteine ligase CoaBC [Acidimicrobiales bacterium]
MSEVPAGPPAAGPPGAVRPMGDSGPDRSEVSLAGSQIVLGVCGGIAAYKAVEICRRLVEGGAHVVPVLTEAATRFVGVTTFSALASERARTELFDEDDPIPHTRLGQRADLVVVVPATARVIGELTAGIAADLLGAVLLATRAPVLLCPAMHTEMWEHPAVQENLATLARRGVRVVPPARGRLAGGDVGAGRLAEPGEIVAAVEALLAGRAPLPSVTADLAGVRVLVTAGGTREPIDPVRFIGNRSSGKQGHALAEVAFERGATVTLVTASDLPGPPGATLRRVETAAEMEAAVGELAPLSDVVVMAAAVADFRPKQAAATKLHKADGLPELVLEPTPDILAGLGRHRWPGQVLVGFAAETGGEEETRARATAKLVAKGVDLVVANDVGAPGVGFAHDTNAVTIVGRDGSSRQVALAPKRTIAAAVLDAVVAVRGAANPG